MLCHPGPLFKLRQMKHMKGTKLKKNQVPVAIRQSEIYDADSPGRWDKQLVNQAADVPSIFFFIISYRLRVLKTDESSPIKPANQRSIL